MDPATLEQFDTRIFKRTLRESVQSAEVREQLGTSRDVWWDLRALFYAGMACLGQMSCARLPPGGQAQGQHSIDPETGESVYEDEVIDEDIASSQLIVKNYHILVKDLARLITIAGITRNILTIGAAAQDLASNSEIKFEEVMFAVIGLSVKITGRGFDSGGTKEDERKWQQVVNEFKRLLATALQIMNNLVAQNERRKLMLWVGLFDHPAEPDAQGLTWDRRLIDGLVLDPVMRTSWDQNAPKEGRENAPDVIQRFKDGLLAHMVRLEGRKGQMGKIPGLPSLALDKEPLSSSPFLLYIGKVGMDVKKELRDAGKPAGATEIATECKRRWLGMSKDEQAGWQLYYHQLLASYRDEIVARDPATESAEQIDAALRRSGVPEAVRSNVVNLAQSVEQVQEYMRTLQVTSEKPGPPPNATPHPPRPTFDQRAIDRADNGGTSAKESDYRITYSSKYGATILQQGKEDLLRRLEPDRLRASRSRRARTRSPPPPPPADDLPPRPGSQPLPDPPDAPLCLASEDEREPLSDEDDSDYDASVQGDDGRGLLTDVPLILGPTEIEVLPMLVQSGIVPPAPGQPGYGDSDSENEALRNMHTLRCHLLLAQDNGRNLVRELLIFVAAWDLREEELYFQLMTQIIEAILVNGLLPFSYHAFRESKDIISPAQAVIMKLLTHIFRRRQAETARRGLAIFPRSANSATSPPSSAATSGSSAPYPHRVDVHVVSFLLTEFRRHIIPQTCALIFLQGQIRSGAVSPEEFPLNLWDMERMYEGIYQYLEFFAILTEHERWKHMMAEWEITSELVTLLEELDRAIPRATARTHGGGKEWNRRQRAAYAAAEAGLPQDSQHTTPVSVERPYDSNTTPAVTAPSIPPPPPLEDEPSDFEWRNLKKLAVLVLSSLVWKSRKVQEQLGAPGPVDGLKGRGIRALLNCCKVDDYNPYIREHAIMALRFALEGNEANQDVVRNLEKLGADPNNPPMLDSPSGAATLTQPAAAEGSGRATITTATGVKVEVPREVLDLNGYETFVDARGQVQLKKKGGGAAASGSGGIVGAGGGLEEYTGEELGEDDFM
jgi:hypothetical protein